MKNPCSEVTVAVCYLCGKEEEITSIVVCDDCQKKMETGIIIVEIDDDMGCPSRTGKIFVIAEESASALLGGIDLRKRAVFVPVSVIKSLGLDKHVQNNQLEGGICFPKA